MATGPHMAPVEDTNPLLQNPWFWMGETLQAILAASATVANLVVLVEFCMSKPILVLLPRDIRYLYCNKALCGLLISLSILIKCLLTFARVSTELVSYYAKTSLGQHKRVYYFDACQYQVGLALAACVALIMTILGASLQRLLAAFAAIPARSPQKQQQQDLGVSKKQRLSAPLLLSVVWLFALAMALGVALIMPPRTSYWHECNAVFILPRSVIIAGVVLIPIVTLMSVLMQVAAWLSTKRDLVPDDEEDEQEVLVKSKKKLGGSAARDSNDNPIKKTRCSIYTETSLTEMNLPSVLLFAASWSVITLFLAYERLIPSFNPDAYLFNVYEKPSYYDENGGFVNEKATTDPPTTTFILTQFFVYIPLLIEVTFDPLCTYWKRPSRSHWALRSASLLGVGDIGNKDGVKDRLLAGKGDDENDNNEEEGSQPLPSHQQAHHQRGGKQSLVRMSLPLVEEERSGESTGHQQQQSASITIIDIDEEESSKIQV